MSATIAVRSEVMEETVRVIVFAIAGYRLALPMESVVRVVNTPEDWQVERSPEEESLVDLMYVGQHAIAVLNLHEHLSSHLNLKPGAVVRSQGKFLVVTKGGEELCAIRVDAPPDVVELKLSTMRQLPSAYREGHPLSVASRVAVLPQGKATMAIFVLELERVLQFLRRS